MSYKEEIQDKIYQFIQDLIDECDEDLPAAHLKLLSFKHLLESQGILLKLYNEVLHNQPFTNDEDEFETYLNQIAKDVMIAYLESMKLWRKNRKTFLQLQSEFVKDYSSMIKDVVERLEEELSNSGSKG
jgi:hypothetical protein